MSYLTPTILLGSVTVGSRCYADTVTNGLVLCEEGLFGLEKWHALRAFQI